MIVNMINVIINGCNGRMGQVLVNEISKDKDMTITSGIDINSEKYNNKFPVFKEIYSNNTKADVIIDFSNPNSLTNLLDYAVKNKIRLIIATTGFSPQDIENIKQASKHIPIFHSANMSLGINVLINLVKKTAPILNDLFDIEIIEKHHSHKIDSPSGTAYMIAHEINKTLKNSKHFVFGRHAKNQTRKKDEIGIHAIRGGTVVGKHEVIFAGLDEIIEIKHSAASKSVFAVGAIKAAKFLLTKDNGLYGMQDLIR